MELFGVEVSVCESCSLMMTGTKATCNNCTGNAIEASEKIPTHVWPDDVEEGKELIGAVPIEELETLADRFEGQGETIGEKGYGPLFSKDYSNGIAAGVGYAESELRELIAEYGDADE
jgi:hypothetical protein